VDGLRDEMARGDMVIGAFVLARLLGLRLLTLEARVVVRDDDRDAAGSGPLVMAQLTPDLPALSPAWPERPDPPGWLGLASGESDPLARAVQLVQQGADTLERTRRGRYGG
jgi:hypothetical protein